MLSCKVGVQEVHRNFHAFLFHIMPSIGKIYNAEKDCNEFACYTDQSTITRSQFVENSLRNAKTEFEVLKRFSLPLDPTNESDTTKIAKYTKIQLKPVTGRGHQLRLHMSSIGHPILGDRLHAPEIIAIATPRLCLHAKSLELPVKISKINRHDHYVVRKVTASSPPPF